MTGIEQNQNPWNQRDSLGFFRAFFITIKMIILHPVKFFATWQPEKSLRGSIVFVLLFVALLEVFVVIVGALFFRGDLTAGAANLAGYLSFLLLFYLAWSFILAFFLQLGAQTLKGQGGYRETFAVSALSSVTHISGFAWVFNGVGKIVFVVLALIWTVTIIALGLRKVHGFTFGGALGAVMIAVIIFSLAFPIFVFFLFVIMSIFVPNH